jgi:hypothetical protein
VVTILRLLCDTLEANRSTAEMDRMDRGRDGWVVAGNVSAGAKLAYPPLSGMVMASRPQKNMAARQFDGRSAPCVTVVFQTNEPNMKRKKRGRVDSLASCP